MSRVNNAPPKQGTKGGGYVKPKRAATPKRTPAMDAEHKTAMRDPRKKALAQQTSEDFLEKAQAARAKKPPSRKKK